MRCPDCNKFVGFDESQFEYDVEVSASKDADGKDGDITVSGSVTQNRPCSDCGTELKSYTFDIEETVRASDHLTPEQVKRIAWDEVEAEVDGDPEETQTGGGRYAKNMVGFSMQVIVTVKFTDEDENGEPLKDEQGDPMKSLPDETFTLDFADAVQASAFEENC